MAPGCLQKSQPGSRDFQRRVENHRDNVGVLKDELMVTLKVFLFGAQT